MRRTKKDGTFCRFAKEHKWKLSHKHHDHCAVASNRTEQETLELQEWIRASRLNYHLKQRLLMDKSITLATLCSVQSFEELADYVKHSLLLESRLLAAHLWSRLQEYKQFCLFDCETTVARQSPAAEATKQSLADESRRDILKDMISLLGDPQLRSFAQSQLTAAYSDKKSLFPADSVEDALYKVLSYLLETTPFVTLADLLALCPLAVDSDSAVFDCRLDDSQLMRAFPCEGPLESQRMAALFEQMCEEMQLRSAERLWFKQRLVAAKQSLAHASAAPKSTAHSSALADKLKPWEAAAMHAQDFADAMIAQFHSQVAGRMGAIETLVHDMEFLSEKTRASEVALRRLKSMPLAEAKADDSESPAKAPICLTLGDLLDGLWHWETERVAAHSNEDGIVSDQMLDVYFPKQCGPTAALLRAKPQSEAGVDTKTVEEFLKSLTISSLAGYLAETRLYYGLVEGEDDFDFPQYGDELFSLAEASKEVATPAFIRAKRASQCTRQSLPPGLGGGVLLSAGGGPAHIASAISLDDALRGGLQTVDSAENLLETARKQQLALAREFEKAKATVEEIERRQGGTKAAPRKDAHRATLSCSVTAGSGVHKDAVVTTATAATGMAKSGRRPIHKRAATMGLVIKQLDGGKPMLSLDSLLESVSTPDGSGRVKKRDLSPELRELARETSRRHTKLETIKKHKRAERSQLNIDTTTIRDAHFVDMEGDDEDYSSDEPRAFGIERVRMWYSAKPLLAWSPPLFFNPCLTEGDYLSVKVQAPVGAVCFGLMRCVACGDCPIYGEIAESRSRVRAKRLLNDAFLRKHVMFVGPTSVWNGRGTVKRHAKHHTKWQHTDDGEDIELKPQFHFANYIEKWNEGEPLPADDCGDEDEWQFLMPLEVRLTVQCVPRPELKLPTSAVPLTSTEDLENNGGIFRVSVLSGQTFTLPIPAAWLGVDGIDEEKADASGSDSDSFASDTSLCTGLHLFVLPCAEAGIYGPPIRVQIL